MARVKRGTTTHARHKKILKMSKGFFGRSKNCYRIAVNRVKKGLQHAYSHRKELKSDMRKLWIIRINAACRINNTRYSLFMNSLKANNINLNRKMLSEMAIREPLAFANLTKQVAIA